VSGHIPILANEVIQLLLENNGKRFVDGTINGGNHASALLKTVNYPIELLGIDWDADAIKRAQKRFSALKEVTLMHGSFGELDSLIERWNVDQVDGIFCDFGLSSDQLDDDSRGFSYRFDSPLDMRYDRTQPKLASDIVNDYSKAELLHVIRHYGEERNASRIANAIIRSRPVLSTGQLTEIIRKSVPNKFIEKTLSRVYMSIRLELNDELRAIEQMLPAALKRLKPHGRMVFLSFDSSQDRLIKHFIRDHARDCICPASFPICVCTAKPELKDLTPKVIRPSQKEIIANPRSRPAKLRAAEKLD
jgi:16S rRNA (cytosine1402-N4)-methyltransferase